MTLPQKCPMCGKTGKRPCPALGGLICPACCGSHRGSTISCPKECSFFPFGVAAYDGWLSIEREWTFRAADYIQKKWGKVNFEKICGAAMPDKENLDAKTAAALSDAVGYVLSFRRDAEGKTLSDRWEAEGWTGLNNDERLMMGYRRHSFVTVIEIQRSLDSQRTECLDLFGLESGPFIVFDRGPSSRVPRFSRLLACVTHYPHFSRIDGAGQAIPSTIWPIWKQEVESLVAVAAKDRPDLSVKQFLSENLTEMVRLIGEIAEEYRSYLMSQMETHRCAAVYEFVESYEKVEAVLKSKPVFKSEEPIAEEGLETPRAVFSWLVLGQSVGGEQEMPRARTLVMMRLYDKRLFIQTSAPEIFEPAKETVTRELGDLVRFQGEEITDLAKRAQEQKAAADALQEATAYWDSRRPSDSSAGIRDAASKPVEAGSKPETARLSRESEEQRLQEAHDKHYAELLDTSHSGLDGLTPRAAAKEPAMRARLVELMKEDLQNLDRHNRETGLHLHLNHALDELGLHELK